MTRQRWPALFTLLPAQLEAYRVDYNQTVLPLSFDWYLRTIILNERWNQYLKRNDEFCKGPFLPADLVNDSNEEHIVTASFECKEGEKCISRPFESRSSSENYLLECDATSFPLFSTIIEASYCLSNSIFIYTCIFLISYLIFFKEGCPWA